MSRIELTRPHGLRTAMLASVAAGAMISVGGSASAWDYKSDGWTVRIDSTATAGAGIVTSDKKTPFVSGDGGPQQTNYYAAPVAPLSLANLPAPVGSGPAGWGTAIGAGGGLGAFIGFWGAMAPLPTVAQSVGSPIKGIPVQQGGSAATPFISSYDTPYAGGINSSIARLNFRPGDFYSASVKASHDIEIRKDNFTAFFRGYYFYDAVLNNGDAGNVSHFSDQVRKYSGLNFVPLDSFIDGKFDVGGHDLNLRVGKQVVNWGESTFLLNGVNAFNIIDVTAFHRPGVELKEAILPQWMVSGSFGVAEGLSVSGWYQLKWDPYNVDAAETWFSGSSAAGLANTGFGGMGTPNPYGPAGATYLGIGGGPFTGNFHRNCSAGFTDLFTPGAPTGAANCAAAVAKFGSALGQYVDYSLALPSNGSAMATRLALGDNSFLQRVADQKAKDGNQFGFAVKYLAEELNSTEFGLYYAQYNSRLPIYSNRTAPGATPTLYPTPQIATSYNGSAGTAAAYLAGFAPIFAVANLQAKGAFGAAAAAAMPWDPAGVLTSQLGPLGAQLAALAKVPLANPGGLLNPWTKKPIANYGDLLYSRAYVLGNPGNTYYLAGGAGLTLLPGLEAPNVGGLNQAFMEYPNGIKEVGGSFNTTVAGIGVQGEVSYKKDDVVQLNDVELLLGTLNSACYFQSTFGLLGTAYFQANSQLSSPNPSGQVLTCDPSSLGSGKSNVAHGYTRVDSLSAQIGTTQTFQPSTGFVRALGANQLVLVTEFGMMHYNNLPKFNKLQLLQSNEVGDSSPLAGVLGLATLYSGFPTGDSGGYVLYTSLEYDNVFGTAVTLNPSIALKHDLFGITPGPNSNYVKDRKALSLGLDGSYQSRIKGSLSYTTNWGGGYANGQRGQSFVAASMSYAF